MIDAPVRRQPASLLPRSAVAFVLVLRDAVFDTGGRAEDELAREFDREDPWGYETPAGRRRFERELQLIESVAGAERIGSALEIGCGEGHFTELLAPRCEALLAVDMNAVALERTRRRCRGMANVRLETWNLRSDEVPGQFDLVVATSVLEYFRSPWSLRRARDKLARAVRPEGHLLLGNVRLDPVVEGARWTRLLPRGAAPVNAFVARHPQLEVLAESDVNGYLATMLGRPERE
jgi:SAM-dependent methyltransferase